MCKLLIKMALILTLAASAAVAQKIDDGGNNFIPPPVVYSGVESAEGTFDSITGMQWGNSIVLNNYGVNKGESYHLTVSLDYSKNEFGPTGGSLVKSGSWSLVVIRRVYIGTIYGVIESGNISYPPDILEKATFKQTQASLRVTGGLGKFEEVDHKIIGSLDAMTELESRQTTGYLSLFF